MNEWMNEWHKDIHRNIINLDNKSINTYTNIVILFIEASQEIVFEMYQAAFCMHVKNSAVFQISA